MFLGAEKIRGYREVNPKVKTSKLSRPFGWWAGQLTVAFILGSVCFIAGMAIYIYNVSELLFFKYQGY